MTVPLSNLTDTWNDGGTAFTAIKMDVTNTASSLLSPFCKIFDLQIGGTSYFAVMKEGFTNIGNNWTAHFPVDPINAVPGSHFVMNIDHIFTNAQMEQLATITSNVGLWCRINGHKTSGDVGYMAGIQVVSLLTVDTGVNGRAVQAGHFTAELSGAGSMNTGMQAFQVEATVTMSAGGEIDGYLSGGEVYANLNSADTCTVVYGLIGQAFVDCDVVTPLNPLVRPEVFGGWMRASINEDGIVSNIYGCQGIADVDGTVDNAYCFHARVPEATATGVTTNRYGLYIENQQYSGATNAENFRSVGATSLNVFEGIVRFGTGTNASPTNGDIWFDGTNLKLRTGGVTKTFTVT
jgi:hypothetical protein